MGSATGRASTSGSFSGTLQVAKSKIRKKYSAQERCGPKRKSLRASIGVSFQKKLIVFDYMGTRPPNSFSRSDNLILARGLLPSLPVTISELEIRAEIHELIKCMCGEDTADLTPNDFEFINMSGKSASVPLCKDGFEWNGRAVKELAGNGCVYVRMRKPLSVEIKSDSEEDVLPTVTLTPSSSRPSTSAEAGHIPLPTVLLPAVTSTPSSSRPSTSAEAGHTPLPTVLLPNATQSSSHPHTSAGHTPLYRGLPSLFQSEDLCSPSPPPFSPLPKEGSGSPEEQVQQLGEMFPDEPHDKIRFLLSLGKHSFTIVFDCLLASCGLEDLKTLAACQLEVPLSECPRIRLEHDDSEDEWVEACVSFYKHSRFDNRAPVKLSIHGQPGVDTGGIRRQFFRVVFSKFSDASSPLCLFEGLPNRLRPAFKASFLSSGLLRIFGTMLGHSFLLDGQGFPQLAEFCFYYIAGSYDQATACIGMEDVGADIQALLTQVHVHV